MPASALARRYGRALFEVASERAQLDAVETELAGVVSALFSDPATARLWAGELVAPEGKKQAIDRLAAGASETTRTFLHLVVDKRREGLLAEMLEAFRNHADEARGVIEAEIRSAVPLDEGDAKWVAERLSEATGKRVRLLRGVDPSLLGGIVIRIGDELIDGSVRTRLARLRERLAAPGQAQARGDQIG